jgi:acetyl-CoA carboxylase alpha subunit
MQRGLLQTPKWNKRHYKKEIDELKKTTQNINEELNKYMENLRKKNQMETLEIKSTLNQTKNTVEGHSSRFKWKTWISELEDK